MTDNHPRLPSPKYGPDTTVDEDDDPRGAWSYDQVRAAIDAPLAARGAVPAGSGALSGKYGDVLTPFVTLMEAELHANSQKGDRPGWLTMSPSTGLLEIYWHTAKLSAAVKNNDIQAITEHSADVANMAMMLLDVCGGLAVAPQQAAHPSDLVVTGRLDALAELCAMATGGWDLPASTTQRIGILASRAAEIIRAQSKPEQAAHQGYCKTCKQERPHGCWEPACAWERNPKD